MPVAASRLMAPVEMATTRSRGVSAPIRMMDPFPSCFSIWLIARLSAFLRSTSCLVSSAAMGTSPCV
jgi:hypothetical protein